MMTVRIIGTSPVRPGRRSPAGTEVAQKIASALTGKPVPPVTGTGATTSGTPSDSACGRLGDRFEILIVEDVDAERGDRERVHRQVHALDQRRRHVLRAVAAEKRDAALFQPRRDRGVIAGFVAPDRPRSELSRAAPSGRCAGRCASPGETLTPAFFSHASRSSMKTGVPGSR